MTADGSGSRGGHTARRIVVFLLVVVAAALLGGLGSGPEERPAPDAVPPGGKAAAHELLGGTGAG